MAARFQTCRYSRIRTRTPSTGSSGSSGGGPRAERGRRADAARRVPVDVAAVDVVDLLEVRDDVGHGEDEEDDVDGAFQVRQVGRPLLDGLVELLEEEDDEDEAGELEAEDDAPVPGAVPAPAAAAAAPAAR